MPATTPNQAYSITPEVAKVIQQMAADLQDLKAWREMFKVAGIDFSNSPVGASIAVKQGGKNRPTIQFLDRVRLKVTSNATGKEKYYGKSFSARTDGARISASSDLIEADLGQISSEEDILFLNMDSVGGTGHTLTENGETPYAIGFFIDYSDDLPPKRVVAGFAILQGCPTP